MATSPVGGTTSLPQYLQKRKPVDGAGAGSPYSTPVQKPPATQPTAGKPVMNPGAPQTNVATAQQPIHDPNLGLAKPIVPPAPPPPQALGMPNTPPNPLIQQMTNAGVRNAAPAGGMPWQVGGAGGTGAPTPNAPGGSTPGATPPPAANPPAPAPAPAAPPAAAPPAQPPAPNMDPAAPTIEAGHTGQAAPGSPIDVSNFQGVLEQILGQSMGGGGRYGNDLIKNMMQQNTQRNNDLRKTETDQATADAASRGVYYGSPLTNSLGDISERYVTRQGEAQNQLLQQIADAQATDQQNAVGNIFNYGQGQQQNSAQQMNLMLALAQLGMMGGPTIPGATGDFGSLPSPQGGDMSQFYQWLGSAFGNKAAAPPKAA